MNQVKNNDKLLTLVNAAVGFFFISVLSVKGGYNYAPILLMLIGLGHLIYYRFSKKLKWEMSADEKRLILIYIFYFSLFVISFLVHGGRSRELDNPLRIIFLLPLLLLFKQYPIRFNVLSHCIPIGAFVAGAIALYDRFILHSPMAFTPRIMHIQGGDISMSLGMFSLILTVYFALKTDKKLTALCLFATLFGMLGSFLSTARGGWIGIPFILVLILWTYRQAISRKFLILIGSVISLTIAIAVATPETKIQERINAAENEISAYIEHNDGSTSVGARFDMWKSALLMAREKPIFGWGMEGAGKEKQRQFEQGIISEYSAQFNHAHNQFLDDLSKRGILGLAALLAVLLIPLVFFLKHTSNPILEIKTIAVLGAIHCTSVIFYSISQGFFTHNSGNIFYFFLVVVFYGMLAQLKREHN